MSQKLDNINISEKELSNITNHVISCKFGGKCSNEVKSFANEITLPLHTYNDILINKQKNINTLLTSSKGNFSLYDGKYNEN